MHNILRKIHGAPDMVIDAEMSAQAEAVAKENANRGALKHTDKLTDQGENLAFNCVPNNQVAKIGDSIKEW